MSYNHRYQGYPYVNPIVTDAPSIAADEASKWANLPRKPISTSRPGGSGISKQTNNTPSTSGYQPPLDDEDETPVIYINMPTDNGNSVCQSIESPDEREPDYLQNTILYDPFDNRRINMPKEDSASEESSISEAAGPSVSYVRNNSENSWRNDARPTTLDLQSPNTRVPNIPALMEKESSLYGGHNSDGFPRSPIPISEFPEPPPAYTEVDLTLPSPAATPTPQVITPDQPRTQVIVPIADPASPVGVMNMNRKNMTCHHCNTRVHTLVIKENGWFTYTIALFILVILAPFVLLIYFTDFFKHKNHYCPSCNKLIGYQIPLFAGKQIHLVTE